MIVSTPEDALHKSWLIRVLIALADQPAVSSLLYFKGGTCASMRGFLDRFSVDLDFDLDPTADKVGLRAQLHQIFEHLSLEIKDQSTQALQFFLKYPNKTHQRSTLKLEILDTYLHENEYETVYLGEIDRTFQCQTIETMFAHKLVAVMDRFEKTGGVAGRDLYDLHRFFQKGYRFKPEIITARTQMRPTEYLETLTQFIADKVTQRMIDQDLNTLLPRDRFQQLRSSLKSELISALRGIIHFRPSPTQ